MISGKVIKELKLLNEYSNFDVYVHDDSIEIESKYGYLCALIDNDSEQVTYFFADDSKPTHYLPNNKGDYTQHREIVESEFDNLRNFCKKILDNETLMEE